MMAFLPDIRFLTIWLLPCFIMAADASRMTLVNLDGGVSPSGKYQVVLQETPSKKLLYTIMETGGKHALLSLPCSYQYEQGESPGWSVNLASESRIFWDADDRLVAIEEVTHHGEGTVLVARITSHGAARAVALPEDALIQATRMKWSERRFFCPDGWAKEHRLELEIQGENLSRQRAVFNALIHVLLNGKMVIESVRRA